MIDGSRHYPYKPPKGPKWQELKLANGPIKHIKGTGVILERKEANRQVHIRVDSPTHTQAKENVHLTSNQRRRTNNGRREDQS